MIYPAALIIISIIAVIYLFGFVLPGIFDTLSNDEIFKKIWGYKKKGQVHDDIRQLCGKITDGIIKSNAEKANYIATKTLRKAQKKVGFPERIR